MSSINCPVHVFKLADEKCTCEKVEGTVWIGPDKIEDRVNFNQSGSKYLRDVPCLIEGKYLDVYAVLDAFQVTCPARQHAIKKLLCSGIRGKGDTLQDLKEAKDAISRAIQMEESKQNIK